MPTGEDPESTLDGVIAEYRTLLESIPEQLGVHLTPTAVDDDGTVHVGKLSFPDRDAYLRFVDEQIELSHPGSIKYVSQPDGSRTVAIDFETPKPERAVPPQIQNAVLAQAEGRGVASFARELAPRGTIDAVLGTRRSILDGRFVDYNGVSIGAEHAPAFEQLVRELARVDPEIIAVLEGLQGKAIGTFIEINADRRSAAEYHPPSTDGKRGGFVQLQFDPDRYTLDAHSGVRVPPPVVLFHELEHARQLVNERHVDPLSGRAAPSQALVFRAIHDDRFHNAEEARVIEGVERRAMLRLGLEPRHSHEGGPTTREG